MKSLKRFGLAAIIAAMIIMVAGCKHAETPHVHSWDNGTVTTEATCTTDGVKTFKCSGCNETKTEVIPAPGHNFSDWSTIDDNNNKTKTCSACHKEIYAYFYTASDIEKIANLTESATVKVEGEISDTDMSAIKTQLEKLDSSIKVDLDLSGTTGLTEIGSYAFSYCKSLSSVTIPSSVTSISSYAFSGCESLKFTVAEGNQNYKASSDGVMLLSKDGTTLVAAPSASGDVTIPEGVTSIGSYAFSWCSSLASVNIPEGVTSIGYGAFSWCSSLASVNIPSSVTSIGDLAFQNCSKLKFTVDCGNQNYKASDDSVMLLSKDGTTLCAAPSASGEVAIPEGVTSIGSGAFYYCSGLTSVTIPEGVTSIGSSAFYYCTSLASVNIPSSVTSIGYRAFSGCESLASVNIPEGVTSIDSEAFSDCESLASVNIPSSVTSISSSAFSGCTSLASVNIPSSVTSIGYMAFSGCSGLTSVTIPEGVTSIGSSAFYYCSGLTSVTIPEGVTSIGSSAFYYCTSLASVNIPSSVTSIGYLAFSGCILTSVTFSDTNGWYSYTSEDSDEGETAIDVADAKINAENLRSEWVGKYLRKKTS